MRGKPGNCRNSDISCTHVVIVYLNLPNPDLLVVLMGFTGTLQKVAVWQVKVGTFKNLQGSGLNDLQC